MKHLRNILFFCVFFACILLNTACMKPMHPLDFQQVDMVEPEDDGIELQSAQFLRGWNIMGPIKITKDTTIDDELIPDEASLTGMRNAPSGAYWQPCTLKKRYYTDDSGMFAYDDFSEFYREVGDSAFYATALLYVPKKYKDLECIVRAGGRFKVWVNGNLIGSAAEKSDDNYYMGQYDVTFKKGYNMIVVKYLDDPGVNPERHLGFFVFRNIDDPEEKGLSSPENFFHFR